MRRPLCLAACLLLACAGPEPQPDVEETPVPDPAAEARSDGMVLDLYDVRDLTGPARSYPGEDINLVDGDVDHRWPSQAEWDRVYRRGRFFNNASDGDVRGRTENLFPREWGRVQAQRRSDLTVRLTNFVAPNLILNPRERTRTEAPAGWRPSVLRSNVSRLLVGENEELPLRSFDAEVRVDGFRARVVLDLVFDHPGETQREGTLQLRLPDGASPFSLAFGEAVISDRLPTLSGVTPDPTPDGILAARAAGFRTPRIAKMARRERAAHAYGEVTRRRVDPALLEWSGAGVFSCRVFPIEPGKTHRIVVGYDVDLTPVGDDLELRFPVPTDVPTRETDIVVADGLKAREEAVTGDGAEEIRVRIADPGPILMTGDDEAAGPCFAAAFAPEVPALPGPEVERAVFLVDVSLSSRPEAYRLWLDLLRAILDRNRGSLREFAVVFFNLETFRWREDFAPNTPANVEDAVRFAESLALEGATDLSAALRAAKDLDGDVFLLSDGAHTWGAADLPAPDRPVFAYVPGFAGSDTRTLARLTAESGGALFTVDPENGVEAAATAHRHRPYRIDSVSVDGCTDLLLAGRPSVLYPGQRLLLAGRGTPSEGAEIRLTLSRDGEERVVRIAPRTIVRSCLAPRIYGQIAVEELEGLDRATDEAAAAFAAHFRVVGESCSLVMLESEADYDRFGIAPERHAKTVRESSAATLSREVRDRRAAEAKRPSEGYLARLRRLADTPGVDFELTDLLTALARDMPAEAFSLPAEELRCRDRLGAQLPPQWQAALLEPEIATAATFREAERRLGAGPADCLRAASCLVERRPRDPETTRAVAFSAMAWGLPATAARLLDAVVRDRPYEPDTRRLLAVCLADAGRTDLALLTFETAVAAGFHTRYRDFTRIVAGDYYRLLRRIERGDAACSVPGFARLRLGQLEKEFGFEPGGLAVTLSWSTDRSDVDLHVADPRGEICYHGHRETKQGGKLTRDVTQGLGPERFRLTAPPPGGYGVKLVEFRADDLRASQATRAFLSVVRGFGTAGERERRWALPVEETERFTTIATVRD